MITLRKSEDRGHVDMGWLKSRHSFSFGEYRDPQHVHFGHLRVINEDWVAPSEGFPTHPHANMEIITFVISGALEHKDSMGTGSVIRPGEIQVMSAGSGVTHSEFNASSAENVHLLQIWIFANVKDEAPNYQQMAYDQGEADNGLVMLVSPTGDEGSLLIKQDARIWFGKFDRDFNKSLDDGRKTWVQMIKGQAEINGQMVQAGDGLAMTNEKSFQLSHPENAELLFFDLA